MTFEDWRAFGEVLERAANLLEEDGFNPLGTCRASDAARRRLAAALSDLRRLQGWAEGACAVAAEFEKTGGAR